jgi:hypothetical protein
MRITWYCQDFDTIVSKAWSMVLSAEPKCHGPRGAQAGIAMDL